MSGPGSVTIWLNQIKEGDQDEAVSKLWQRYFEKLVTRARNHLRGQRVTADGEDIALMAFDRFLRAVKMGRFPRLNDRNDLWKILLVLTSRVSQNQVLYDGRKKRGGGIKILSITPPDDSTESGLHLESDEPDPAEAVALAEGVEEMLAVLKDPNLCEVAILALEGYTNQEIGDRINRVESTVGRKLRLIRECWKEQGLA